MEIEDLRKQWGIEDGISNLIISLYDDTANYGKRQISRLLIKVWNYGISYLKGS